MNKLLIYISFFFLTFVACKDKVEKKDVEKFAITGDELIDKLTVEVNKDPLNPKLRFQRAERLYEKKMYNECLEDLRVAISADSLQPQYYHLASDAFMDNNLSNRALQSMQKVAALFPTRIPTLLKLSETQLILEQYDASILTLNEIVKIDPQNAEAYFMLGTTLKSMGEEQRAINAFQTATEFDAKLTDAWISLGNIFEKRKDKNALTFYQTAVNIDQKNVVAKHALAYFYQNQNQEDKALELYAEINAINPSYVDAHLNAGILYLERNDLGKAYEQFNILVGIDPKDWTGHHYRGIVNFENKKYVEALADFRSSTNLNPDNEKGLEMILKCEKLIKN
jgi:tetratricopeptide (TPR) repeat protein